MTKGMIKAGVFVLALLAASPAFALGGGWSFNGLSTLDYSGMGWGPPYDYVDGKIYMPDGTTLVDDGSLVQIIIGLDGAEIVDPIEYFDADDNGTINGAEVDNVAAWIQAGADPAAISGGTNVLAYGTLGFTGEFGTVGGTMTFAPAPGSEPVIANGLAHDKFAWRAWSMTAEQMEALDGAACWYTTCRELGTHANGGGGPDTGWWLGMPDMGLGDDLTLWSGFSSPIGAEVYTYHVLGDSSARSQNRLDHYLPLVPEPATVLLVGGGLLQLVAKMGRKRSRAAAE